MKLYRGTGIWSLMLGRLSLSFCRVGGVASFAISLAPVSRPWWSIGDGYIRTALNPGQPALSAKEVGK